MSLTFPQKKGLAKISDCFLRLENLSTKYDINIDSFINAYKEQGSINDWGELVKPPGAVAFRKKIYQDHLLDQVKHRFEEK